MPQVVDSHIHLAVGWQKGKGGLPNSWLRAASKELARDWTEPMYLAATAGLTRTLGKALALPFENTTNAAKAKPSVAVKLVGAVFVECCNEPPAAEARWALQLAADASSVVQAVVANIPVAQGAEAVDTFLAQLAEGQVGGAGGQEEKQGGKETPAAVGEEKLTQRLQLPPALKGGRGGGPIQPLNACIAPTYLSGLRALCKHGLHWEFCCSPQALSYVGEAIAQSPSEMTFVLDHLGHNNGSDGDFEQWSRALKKVADSSDRVFAKLGAVEEWGLEEEDPVRYLCFAFEVFGFERVLYESNWFMCDALGGEGPGGGFHRTTGLVLRALREVKATREQIQEVFGGNAKRLYGIN